MKGLSRIASKEKRFKVLRFCLLLFVFGQFFGNAILSFCYVFLVVGTLINLDSLNKSNKRIFVGSILFFAFFLTNALSSAINAYEFKEFLKVEKLSAFLIFPVIFLISKNLFTQQNFINKLKLTYFIGGNLSLIILLAIATVNSINYSSVIYFTYNELTDPLGIQPIYYGAFYCLAIIFGFDLLTTFKKHRMILGFGTLLLTFGVILIASRISWIILAIILPIKMVPFFKKNRKAFYIALFSLLTFSFLIFTNPTLNNRLFLLNSNVSSYSGLAFRMKIWENVFDLIYEKPTLGFGAYEAELELQKKFSAENFRRAYFLRLNAHNQYLQTMLESGALGLFSLLLILLFFLYNAQADKNKLLFLTLICLSLLTESYLRRFNGVLFFCYFYFFFLLIENKKSSLIDE